MNRKELLEQITSIATTIDQLKYTPWINHSGLVMIFNELLSEYYKGFIKVVNKKDID